MLRNFVPPSVATNLPGLGLAASAVLRDAGGLIASRGIGSMPADSVMKSFVLQPNGQPSTSSATPPTRPYLPPRKRDMEAASKRALFHSTALQHPIPSSSPFPHSLLATRGFAAPPSPPKDPHVEPSSANSMLKEVQEKRRGTSYPEPSLTLGQRAAALRDSLVSAGRAVVAFVASLPSRTQRLLAMTPQERREGLQKAWKATKEVLHHFWVGTKLLWTDVKVSSRLTLRILNGKELTRREKRQLTRTAADLFRLVPMIVILVVPFLEFALPVLLRVFPNMLPSTFEDKLKKEEELKKRLAAKLEIARFLQDTVSEMAEDIVKHRGRNQASAQELVEFINKVRAGQPVSNLEILRFAPLFNDELTLDNLDRVHLTSICKFVGIQPFGTDAFLRSRIRFHIRKLKEDDREIRNEGLAALSDGELREACRARAMRAPFGPHSREFMERQMQDWLDLSLGHALPSSLLLLSRAMTIGQDLATGPQEQRAKIFGGLVDTLQTLPDEVVETVESDAAAKEILASPPGKEISDRAQRSAQMAAKLELIQQEEEAIREEEAERKERTAALEHKPAAAQKAGEGAGAAATSLPSEHPHPPLGQEEAAARAMVRAAAINVVSGLKRGGKPHEHPAPIAKAAEAVTSLPPREAAAALGISEEELRHRLEVRRERRIREVIRALATLASPSSSLVAEKEEFMDLVKAEVDRINKDVCARGSSQLLFSGGLRVERPEDKGAPTPTSSGLQVLTTKVDALLSSLEKEIETADQKLQGKLQLLDLDGDGRISRAELLSALDLMHEKLSEEEVHSLLARLQVGEGPEGSVDVQELLRMAKEDVDDDDHKE